MAGEEDVVRNFAVEGDGSKKNGKEVKEDAIWRWNWTEGVGTDDW